MANSADKEIAVIKAKVKSIEEELRLLKTHVESLEREIAKPRRFTDLYGVLKGKTDFTYDEIQEAEIRVKEF